MSKNKKKALKGLRALNLLPIVTNTDEAYEVGQYFQLIGAQRLTKDDQRESYEVYADDELYESASDYKYTDIQVQVVEFDLELEALISGGLWDQGNGVYTARTIDEAPEYALTYAALSSSGYRLFRHLIAKLMSAKVDHETKGDGNAIAAYTLNFRCQARKIDGAYRESKDVEISDDFSWIKNIEALPIVAPTQVAYTLTADGSSGNVSSAITIALTPGVSGLTKDHLTIEVEQGKTVTIGELTGDDTSYTLAVTPEDDAEVTITIATFGGFAFATDEDSVTVYKAG